MPGSWFVPRRAAVFVVLAACLVLGACSPGGDYPSLFPSVHDIPPPRTDAPLDSNQVQQATEDLISARDRLSAGAQGTQAKNSNNPPVKAAAKSATKSPVNSRAAASPDGNPATAPASVRKQPGTPVSAQQTVGTDADQTAGTETK
jgi:hypothetical protein